MLILEPCHCRPEKLKSFRFLWIAEVAQVRVVISPWTGAIVFIFTLNYVLKWVLYIIHRWPEFLLISTLVKHSIFLISWHLRCKKTRRFDFFFLQFLFQISSRARLGTFLHLLDDLNFLRLFCRLLPMCSRTGNPRFYRNVILPRANRVISFPRLYYLMRFLLDQVAVRVRIPIDVLVGRNARCINFWILNLFLFWKPPLNSVYFVWQIGIVLSWTWSLNRIRIRLRKILKS